MKPFCFFVIAIATNYTGYSQKEANIWIFGDHAGLDFNHTPPTPVTGAAIMAAEGCTSIADRTTGQLLFYTNGVTVWDRNHNPMPASIATPLYGGISSTQSSVIVPQPDQPGIYYIFTTPEAEQLYLPPDTNPAAPNMAMCYSVVDMSLNGGMGDLTVLNVPVMDSSTEKVAVVGNCDRSAYWVVGHRWNCDSFYAFKLTASGLSDPVKSRAGAAHQDIDNDGLPLELIGHMKFSSDGLKLAVVVYQNTLEVFNFDWNTGIVNGPEMTDVLGTGVPEESAAPLGCSFSPDNSRLYLGCSRGWNYVVFQYDMLAGSATAILASRTAVAYIPVDSAGVGALQNGPDGKMYLARWNAKVLSVINNPNAVGAACDFQSSGPALFPGVCLSGLPAMVESFLSPGTAFFNPPSDTIRCGDAILSAAQQRGRSFVITPVEGWAANGDSLTFSFFPEHTTTYKVVGFGPCSIDTTIFTIYVSEGPIADFTIEPAAPDMSVAQITLTDHSQRAQTYAWHNDAGVLLSETAHYVFPNRHLGTFCFVLKVWDSAGCNDTARKCVEVKDDDNLVFIPNTFSPNGDGLNDVFTVDGFNFRVKGLSIYNRWGERVFYSMNGLDGWNGFFRGKPCEAGIYFYQLVYTTNKGETVLRKGDLLLVR